MTKEDYIVWASGFYLTEKLPEAYVCWDSDTLDEYLLDSVWEPFEGYSADDLWEYITNLANSAMEDLN